MKLIPLLLLLIACTDSNQLSNKKPESKIRYDTEYLMKGRIKDVILKRGIPFKVDLKNWDNNLHGHTFYVDFISIDSVNINPKKSEFTDSTINVKLGDFFQIGQTKIMLSREDEINDKNWSIIKETTYGFRFYQIKQ
jgi:hypothetical protein